jgi:pSer/pThr/pTyr-binding forkhead associated (FHA) protein
MADLILEIVEGAGAGKQVPVDAVVDIGRDPGLPIVLEDDPQVSRRHARVSAQGGQATAEDLGSTNGTYVNEQPIHMPRALQPGDKIRIGTTIFELRSQQQVQARPSAVQIRPDITAVDNSVLAPAAEAELAPAPAVSPEGAEGALATAPPPEQQQVAGGPGLRGTETPPAFVPPEVVGDPQAESDYGAISRWVDVKVKQQQRIAAFAMISAAAIAVIVYFGLS